jgi:hypothetical protein
MSGIPTGVGGERAVLFQDEMQINGAELECPRSIPVPNFILLRIEGSISKKLKTMVLDV